MKISTEIISASRIVGAERAVETIAKAGFDAWDFSISSLCEYDYENHALGGLFLGNDYLKISRKLKQIAQDNGIYCNQSHAPCPSDWSDIRSSLKRAIECTAEAGGKYCIIHPLCYSNPQENAEMYLDLIPFAKEHNVKIATENMFFWENDMAAFAPCATPESFNEHINLVNDEYLVACLDIGHAEMKGIETDAVELVKALGDKLKCLHIHDNDKWHDLHDIPFSGSIEYKPIVKALKDINYDGEFTLEASSFLKAYNEENIIEGTKKLAESARKLAKMFEND